jgi:hypothetical protein
MDFGKDAYDDTLKALDEQGIAHVGRAGEVYKTTVNGIRVAVTGFTQPYYPFYQSHHDIAAAAKIIADIKKDADVIVVGLHGGNEGPKSLHTPIGPEYIGDEYRGEVVKTARAFIDAGASLVVGFGPHLPRAMEMYEGKLISYSLGNFVTYGPFNLRGPNGLTLILHATFDKQGKLLGARIEPLVVPKPGIPKKDPSGQTLEHLRTLSKEDFPKSAPKIDPNGCVAP